jgi:hypothetical protein
VRYIRPFWFALSAPLILAAPAPAQTASGYTAPAEFMNLFFDFTGSNEPGYPAGQPTLGQMLTQSVTAKEPGRDESAPLVLLVGSDIYVYDSKSGARLSQEQFRDDPTSGFFEMTRSVISDRRSPIWRRSRPTATSAGKRVSPRCRRTSRKCACSTSARPNPVGGG